MYNRGFMAPKRVKKPGRSAQYYRDNPESYRKKLKYDTKSNKTAKDRKYRSELAMARAKAGLKGKRPDLDMCHTKGGKVKPCNAKKNRAKGGGKRK